MNEKDSPCVDAGVTIDLTNCFGKVRDAADGPYLNIQILDVAV